ncbi:MAG: hypothetical protein ACMV0I_05190 [Pseudomonas sp.]
MLDRLLGSIYSALDKGPNELLALRVRHPDGFVWSVANRTLTAATQRGEQLAIIPLRGITISSLAGRLTRLGCQVLHVNEEIGHRSAAVLISGSSALQINSPDLLLAYDSLLWSILDAYAIELEGAKSAIDNAIDELNLGLASADWLDLWGEYFNIPRGARDDDAYRQFIVDETLRARCNPVAISKAIWDTLGVRVEIEEPVRHLARLSAGSRFDDDYYSYDGKLWGPHLIRPVSRGAQNLKWSRILPIIEKNRPAGVVVLSPEWRPPVQHLRKTDHAYGLTRHELHVHTAKYADKMYLDEYVFGDEVTQNYRVQVFNLHGQTNTDGGMRGVLTGLGAHSTFVRAQAILSDGVTRFGDENCRFIGVANAALETHVFGEAILSGGLNGG